MNLHQNTQNKSRELASSLWTCGNCGTFVTIHSPASVAEVWCPTCDVERMNLCGAFEGLLEVLDTPEHTGHC
jgi:hypothetical protein